MKATAATGSPMTPSSISRPQVWMPAPRNVSGALPTRSPIRPASASISAPLLREIASGFSV